MGIEVLARRVLDRAKSGELLMNREDRALLERLHTRTLVTNGAAVVLYDEAASNAEISTIMGCVKRYHGDPKLLFHTTNTLWDQL